MRQEVNAATFAQVDGECERLMQLHSELVPIYVIGSDEAGWSPRHPA